MPRLTLYEILELTPDATPDQISFAYRRLTEQLARDGKENSAEMSSLRNAYDTLSHPMRRSAYNLESATALESAELAGQFVEAESWFSVPWVRWALGGLGVVILLIFWKNYLAAKLMPTKAQQVAAAVKKAEAPDPNVTQLGVLPRSAEEIFSALGPSVAKVIVNDSSGNTIATGSGVVVAPGTVVTNCHVVARGRAIQLKFPSETLNATLQQSNEERDICHLYSSNISARPVPVSSANSVRVGQKVFAIGSPYGLENTLSEGLVSALREVPGGTVIQTSAPISPGSSGGGLFDQYGNLVGIMTFQHKYGQNLNFAVPADWIGNIASSGVTTSSTFRSADAADAEPSKPAAPAEPTAHDILPGKWACTGTFEGTTGTWTFSKSGSVMIEREGKSAKNSFALQASRLVVFDPLGVINLDIDEIKQEKLSFSGVNGRKMTCERR